MVAAAYGIECHQSVILCGKKVERVIKVPLTSNGKKLGSLLEENDIIL